ncbi:aconitase family protein [Caminicella sporogenes]|uniref:aconitase family protein n=1 Tax=Caminicella sporogenes TaxID=166485 RepID=UPI002FE6E90B
MPKVLNIELKGKLNPWISAKDVILHILKKLTVKGGVGYVIEYSDDGIKELSVTDRATLQIWEQNLAQLLLFSLA